MGQSATNSGDIVGKVDQHMGGNKADSGYKYQYVNVDKNKKLGIITKDNINHILYNLLWDIVSHQVDNETAKGEMSEVNWLLKRYPKDNDRSDDTGVSNTTINKYIKKAKDIVGGMKEPVEEEVYVEDGKLTKHPGKDAKKLNEDVDDSLNEETYQSTTVRHIRDDLISCGANADDIKEYIDFCVRKKYLTEGQKKDLLKKLKARDTKVNEDLNAGTTNTTTPAVSSNVKKTYSYKKVHDIKGDHWQVFDQDNNLVATYETEELARKAVQGKRLNEGIADESVDEETSWSVYSKSDVQKMVDEHYSIHSVKGDMNEEYNPFKEMIKSDSQEWHRGLYTDGEGSFYEAPKSGTTKWQKKKNYKYRYNFGKNQIEIADNSGDVIYDSYLSVGSWLDNPEYWFDRAYKDMEDEDEAFINDYFKKHPDADKRNKSSKKIEEESLNEDDNMIAEYNGYYITSKKRFGKTEYNLYYQAPNSGYDGLIYLGHANKLDDLLTGSIKSNKGAVKVVELAKKEEK